MTSIYNRRILYLENEIGKLEYEISPDNLVFIHCDINKWTHATFKKGLVFFVGFLEYLHSLGYQSVYGALEDNRLALIAGGRYLTNAKYLDKEYEVYVWDQPQG